MSTMPGSNPAIEKEIASKATTALICGIVGLFCCMFVGIYAIIVAGQGEKLIAQYGVGQEHASKLMIGKVLGFVAIGLFVLGIVANVIMMAMQG
ncbi:hypothetical protein Psta_1378 [Pirellula staleyi DSM 6068]|uniref:DUF4190 domain-containing protein n=1 Tax=Pirellula staleyi (strain ATCC 27377 / DSM 6068 / ICPB 4128) TaxID=530564 RepID=D2QWV1_PIRSD|nr:hypothetical protein [Pirellula staleyi]ADB16055.1 hypothetical protein Psta_1378 [Pirellula staleyi DSM 6068]